MRVPCAALLLLLGANWALAQQPLSEATPAELIWRLNPVESPTRSLRNLRPVPRAVDLAVNFDFDSAQLSGSSHALLGNLAEAVNAEQLKQLHIRIEGHTDAMGSARYNEGLSMRRAQAVLGFLVERGVDPARMTPAGMAARDLLLPDRPFAAQNRRVRIAVLPAGAE